jgi:hypothetical protein
MAVEVETAFKINIFRFSGSLKYGFVSIKGFMRIGLIYHYLLKEKRR